MRRSRQLCIDVTEAVVQVRRDVVRHIVVNLAIGAASCIDAHHRIEDLVGDLDLRARVLGDIPIACHHHDDRLADMIDLVFGQRKAVAGSDDCGVRNQKREPFGHRFGILGQILVRVDGMDTRHFQCGVHFDVGDPRMGVR